MSKITVFILFTMLVILLSGNCFVDGRYLPTRSNTDRLDKLRELLKELIENEIQREEIQQQDVSPKWHPETKLFFKREVKQPFQEKRSKEKQR